MRYYNFWCISFVTSEFFKHVQKTPKSWKKVCSITIFHQKPEKTLLQAWKPLKIACFLSTSFSDNHGQKSWDTFAFLGCFPIHTSPTPPLTPQTTLDVIIISKTRASGFIRGSRHQETDESTRLQAECFYYFLSNETKKDAVIHFFAIVLLKWKNNNFKHCFNMHD